MRYFIHSYSRVLVEVSPNLGGCVDVRALTCFGGQVCYKGLFTPSEIQFLIDDKTWVEIPIEEAFLIL